MNPGARHRRLWQEFEQIARWWQEQMQVLRDRLMETLFPGLAARIEFIQQQGTWTIWERRGRSRKLLAQPAGVAGESSVWSGDLAAYAGARAVMGLEAERVMTREPVLAATTDRDVPSSLALYLQREQPLRADLIAADWQIISRDRAANRYRVRVWIARSEDVRQAQQLAMQRHLRVVQIGVAEDTGEIRRNFLSDRIGGGLTLARPLVRGLWVGVGALVVMWAGVFVAQSVEERLRVDPVMQALKEHATVLRRMQTETERRARPAQRLVAIMQQPDATDALAALTDAIPDTAWVYEAQVSASGPLMHVELMGIAPQAAVVEKALVAARGFRGVTLLNSLPDGIPALHERFQIAAEWTTAQVGTPLAQASPPTPSLEHDR